MNFWQSLISMTAAGMLMVSSSLRTAAPQNDVDGTLFLVNRQWTVADQFEPETVDSKVKGQVRNMRADAAAALREMFEACREEIGVTLVSVSGFRNFTRQSNIYRRKLKRVHGDVARAQEYVAPPNASEHRLGLAMDIGQRDNTGLTASFGKTKGGQWTRENSWRFGFILRYDEPWEEITGYKFEPWHFRYVGKENAKAIHEANVPFETWMAQCRLNRMKELLSGGKDNLR